MRLESSRAFAARYSTGCQRRAAARAAVAPHARCGGAWCGLRSGKESNAYSFTTAFHESEAFSNYRKNHLADLVLPGTMSDAAVGESRVTRASLL